jgi:uncharacterized Zn-binding protein involved in type VI secretion
MIKRALLCLILILGLIVPATGCSNISQEEALAMLSLWLQNNNDNQKDSEDEDSGDKDSASLVLTYPAGRSPNVFTTGWVFGARCSIDDKDYSDQVQWSGSGSFAPDTGSRSRPSFNSEGANTITLSVTVDKKEYSKTFSINAVSSEGYACVNMNVKCPSYSQGCIGCPHTAIGPITHGSSHVFINGMPAARVGDGGVMAPVCGPCDFTITSGDSSVLIDGKPAARIGSQITSSGGVGKIIGY